jgi:nicotinamidase-related amidase
MRVVYIMMVHRADGVDVEKFRAEKFRRSPYLVKGTKGAEMIEALRSQEGDYCVEKHRFDAFHETELDDLLRRLGVRTVVVVGVQTPACVRESATGAIQRDYDTIVLSDATTTASPEAHRSNLADMANLGARIMTVDEFLKLIE